MAVPSSPASEFCAACGFPLRGPRCDACGVDRSPSFGRRSASGEPEWDVSTVDAWRVRDPIRFVAHCVSAESGLNIQATSLPDGVGWIVPFGAMTVFVGVDMTTERVAIDVPIARVAERQRVPLLRTALELCWGPSPCRICLRDDLLLLRRVGRVASFSPEALRRGLRESADTAQRLGATLTSWFEARAPFPEEQRANLTWASAGRARPLKSFSVPPGPGARSSGASSVRAPAAPPSMSAMRLPHEPLSSESSAWAAPPLPRLPESVARPIRDIEAIPDILSPSFAVPSPPSAVTVNGGVPSRNGGSTKIGILPPAHDAGVHARSEARSEARSGFGGSGHEREGIGSIKAIPPHAPAPMSLPESAPPGDLSAQQADRDRRIPRTMPFRRTNPHMAAVSPAPLSVRPPPMPELEIEPPSRRSVPSRPDPSNSPADRLCQLLRDAHGLATALSSQERPGTMVLLIRSTVFRAIFEFGGTLPDAVAHLYRSTAAASRELVQQEGGARRANAVSIAEPALLVMDRIVSLRGQVPEEKPLHIDPLSTAALAREHLGRYLREIERAPTDPALRHFLALGALSELLARTKLPAKTEQRLRDIVAYAQRDGAKTAAIDLLMTALTRIVAQ